MRVKEYVKVIILEAIPPKGCYARDLVDEVSKRVGKPYSVQRIGSYLRVMFASGDVRREEETKSGRLIRYKWFRNVG